MQSENSDFIADIFGAHFILTNTHDFDKKNEKSSFDIKINVQIYYIVRKKCSNN